MAEDQKKTTNTQNQAERLLGCLPSTSVLTIPSNRFDVQASKSLILEVASSLVAEKSIFGDMGRKKFREIYNDKFPSLKENSSDSEVEQAINTRNSVEPVVHIAEKSRMNDLEKFTAKKCGKTDATDQNQKTTSSFGDETSFLSHCDSESHYKKLGTRNTTIGTVIQASSSNAMIFEETPENLSETDVQTPEKTRELDLDETEIIELDTQHDLEDEIPSSSTKLPNQSGVNMFPKESKSTYSGIKAGFGSPESETVGSFEVANENKSRSFGIRDNSCKTVKPVKFPCPNELNANSTTPAELVDEKNKTELPTYSDKFLETRKHISGSQDIFCLKGLNEEQKSSWFKSIESLNTDAITWSGKDSRGTRFATAKIDLNNGDFISHLRGRMLNDVQAKTIIKSNSKTFKLFPLGRLFGNKFVDTSKHQDWPASNIYIHHLEGNCAILELEKGPKVYYCFYACKFIKRGSRLVYCSRK